MYTGILEAALTLSARARTRFRGSARVQDPHGRRWCCDCYRPVAVIACAMFFGDWDAFRYADFAST